MATTYEAIATVTVGSGGASSIDFTSIPATYTDLLVKYSLRSTQSVDYNYAYMRINGITTSSYSFRLLYADSNTAGSTNSTSAAQINTNLTVGASSTASTFSNGEFYIPNYTSTNNKSICSDAVTEKNASTNVGLYLGAALFTTSSAVTSVSLYPDGGQSFVQHSSATLYGIKKN